MIERATAAKEILVSSPYITDARLFKKCESDAAFLYTDFSALPFITGASSLHVLKKLETRGIRKFFDEIHRKARPVSTQEICEMEKLVQPFARKFKEIEKAAEGIDHFLDAKQKLREKIKQRMKAALEKKKREEQEARKRDEEEARKTAEERSKKERSERMRQALADFEKFFRKGDEVKSSRLTASVKVLTNHPRDFMVGRTTSTQSLVPLDRSQNFEQLLKSIGVTPMRYYRHLIVDRTTGKLGFVRFAKGQWTYFASGVRPHEKIMIGGFPWNAEIKFDWRSGGNQSNNGDVHLYVSLLGSDKRIRVASAGFTFSIAGVQLEKLVMAPDETLKMIRHMPKVRDFNSVVASRPVQEFLIQHLTKPFKFSSNSIGEQANNFFGGTQASPYRIQAHKLGNHAIFSAQHQ